ncbi:hypothetical protein AAFF_G00369110 [Aldrovandia affinis]|uniref:Uncharacterized protein n=1 Tax=Aldrovandia affinis TaxID=143900 RepID=A0AAD7SH57_9TELE|nr:hypothetical protein AAFF_G00369110 [Aldrovandia affinis]
MIELEITVHQTQGYPWGHSPTQPLKSDLRKPFQQKAHLQKLRRGPAGGPGFGEANVALPRGAGQNGRRAQASAILSHDKGGQEGLGCLWEETCLPPCPKSDLPEPFSGFQHYLHQQLLRSPSVYRAAEDLELPDRVAVHHFHGPALDPVLQVPLSASHLTPHSPLPERTVKLADSHAGSLPKITMTCPTPSPKPPVG